MAARILYKSSVSHDLRKIAPRDVQRILQEIQAVLGGNPSAGTALSGEFEGLFRIRVGDYRVIYTVVNGDVIVLRIGHRSKAYH